MKFLVATHSAECSRVAVVARAVVGSPHGAPQEQIHHPRESQLIQLFKRGRRKTLINPTHKVSGRTLRRLRAFAASIGFTKAKLEKALPENDERLSRYLDRLDEADGQDEGGTGCGEVEHIQEKIAAIQGRRERFEEHRDALAASGEGQLSLTDPDSRAMHAETRVGVGYNIQIAVDAKHKLIAEQQVHIKVSDLGLLAETAVAARRNLAVHRIDAVADAGYFKIEDIEACENAGWVMSAKGWVTQDCTSTVGNPASSPLNHDEGVVTIDYLAHAPRSKRYLLAAFCSNF